MKRSLFAGAALLAAVVLPAGANAQNTIKIGVVLPYSGQFADGSTQIDERHQALHEAARRHRRRQEDRNHPQGYRRHRSAGRKAPRRGTRRARQGRHPRRLAAHAECDRRMRRVGRGQKSHGHHERGDLDHRRQVALLHALLVHAADGNADARRLGGQERRQESLHDGFRLWPGHDAEADSTGIQGQRRRNRRFGAHAGRKPGLLGLRPARQGPQSGSDLRVHPWRRAAGGNRQGICRTRHRPQEDQGPGHRRTRPTTARSRAWATPRLGIITAWPYDYNLKSKT